MPLLQGDARVNFAAFKIRHKHNVVRGQKVFLDVDKQLLSVERVVVDVPLLEDCGAVLGAGIHPHCLRIFVDGGDFRTAGRVGYFNSFGRLVIRHVVQPPDPEGNRELVSAQV